MKAILKIIILSSGLWLTATNADASNITGRYDTWAAMKADGWQSSDGFNDNRMHNALLWNGDVINQYPWTKYALLRHDPDMPMFLADKQKKTLSLMKLKTRSGARSDLRIIYQGEDKGKGCYISIVDSGYWLEFERQQYLGIKSYGKPDDKESGPIKPEILMTLPENCINKQQLNAIKAKQKEKDRALQQWVGEQTLKELCRQTGNC
ncbi:hypothetical protein [Aeromonas rivipollensis]|uniref:hypothetical protein n=1 Tax=Aeromonas rivipollensis TaxID=948519 RepID=UPI00399D1617